MQDLSDLKGLNKINIGKFDLIVCTAVMEHVGDHYGLAQFISKHLSRKGLCIISTPSMRSEKVFHTINKNYMPELTGHVRQFNGDDVLDLARKNGMIPLSIKTICSEFFVANFILFLFRAKIDENTGKILEPERLAVKAGGLIFKVIRKLRLNKVLNKIIYRNYLMCAKKDEK